MGNETFYGDGLILVQKNAESEGNLLVNAHIVTEGRTLLGERTSVGVRSVKDAVKLYDPENRRPEKIALTDGLLTAGLSTHPA